MTPLLPPDHPDAPKYWMHETSGLLAAAMERYLNKATLTTEEIRVIKAYLWQWVGSPVWSRGSSIEGRRAFKSLLVRVAAIASREDIDQAIEAAADLGMDPL